MERIAQARSATLTHTFLVDGTPTNPSPDTATLTITRDDGTAVVTAAAATEAGTGLVTYTLTPAQTATLDRLRFDWTATFGGQPQTFTDWVEIVGGFICGLDQLKALFPTRSAGELADIRTQVEQRLERELGYATVPRYASETVPVSAGRIWLRPRIRAIRAVTVDGTVYTAGQLAALTVHSTFGIVDLGWRSWCATSPEAHVTYEHGQDEPDTDVARVALLLAGETFAAAGSTEIRPTVDDVAALERTRTVTTAGVVHATFDTQTRPTAVQVDQLIDLALETILAQPEAVWSLHNVALLAAIFVETSFFRETLDEGPVSVYRDLLVGAGVPLGPAAAQPPVPAVSVLDMLPRDVRIY